MNQEIFSQQITFLHSSNLKTTHTFYSEMLGLPLVRDQATCLIFKVNQGALLGFCEHIEPISNGRRLILTLVHNDVDGWYQMLKNKDVAIISKPEANPKYQIYHFFFKDPDGYWIEIQKFDKPL